ncbi:MAG: hypothetical protein MZV64_10210 [Ignavibacteriales bacterium]|nr:hypothetical protein [Ignavibacteriales bacterium]
MTRFACGGSGNSCRFFPGQTTAGLGANGAGDSRHRDSQFQPLEQLQGFLESVSTGRAVGHQPRPKFGTRTRSLRSTFCFVSRLTTFST